ncbi:hypothetical protein B0I35DRAFT_425228 [Stachybotrys elegans]|uniref:DUF7029 domain-containing protein n=1 Tax=Stachybotrys elegans TaxID=80388 RepID=A0A8K0T1L0_9HYPO|nr:hypothetical protein B0I35DRAFT_425228 [Stachybotrys elegans]
MLFNRLAASLAAATLIQALPHGEERPEGGFEVVIVRVRAEDCSECAAQPSIASIDESVVNIAQADPVAETEPEPESNEPQPSATKPTASFTQDQPIATLKPNVHWTCDTKPAKNVVPLAAEEGSQLYYGLGSPDKAGEFAFLTYYFNRPSVNLDHTDHVTDVVFNNNELTVHFASEEAWDYAVDTWSEKDELVLITYTEGCGAFEKEERCFFQVSSITQKDDEHNIVAKGKPVNPEEIATKANSEWGYWVPREKSEGAAAAPVKIPSKPVPGKPAPGGFGNGTAPTKRPGACVPPVDGVHNLPTACLGDSFDLDLDSALGAEDMSHQYSSFLETVIREAGGQASNQSLVARNYIAPRCGFFCKAFNKFVVQPVKQVIETVKQALTVDVSLNEDFSFKIPDPESDLAGINDLIGLDLINVDSPFGPAIQLFSIDVPPIDGVPLEGGLDIFCVGCGVSGSVRISGRAAWVPFEGITEGFIELHNDITFSAKLGVDANIALKQDLDLDLFNVGLPGLSFGVITIGPRISLGAKVGVEALASGRLLAGGELALQNAAIVIDIVNRENTRAQAWEPFFTPVLEVEGELSIKGSLGLPVGIFLGVQIATFDLSVGIVDEPSISAAVQVAANIELVDGNTFEGGFLDVNGCTGLGAQLSFRNELRAEILGLANIPLFDTGDISLAQACLELPSDLSGGEPAPPAAQPRLGMPVEEAPVAETPAEEAPVEQMPPVVEAPAAEAPAPSGMSVMSYKDANGFEYAPFISPGSANKVAVCSNGNLYAMAIEGAKNPSCADAFTFMEKALVSDGAKRVMHYYNNTMSVVGVSRLRAEEASSIPSTGVVVALAPYEGDSDANLYLAVDPQGEVFYPMVCEYKDGTAAKLFLAKDPVIGAQTLASPAVQHSITGGEVSRCSPLELTKGANASGYADLLSKA